MFKTLTRVALGIALVACVAGCWQTKFVAAEQCVLVDLRQDDGGKLMPDLDAFAQVHGLIPDKSVPMMTNYTLHVNGRKRALISFSVGMSEFGAELALFQFGEPGDDKLKVAFEGFVDREIKTRFGVKRCADVPDHAPMKASD